MIIFNPSVVVTNNHLSVKKYNSNSIKDLTTQHILNKAAHLRLKYYELLRTENKKDNIKWFRSCVRKELFKLKKELLKRRGGKELIEKYKHLFTGLIKKLQIVTIVIDNIEIKEEVK